MVEIEVISERNNGHGKNGKVDKELHFDNSPGLKVYTWDQNISGVA